MSIELCACDDSPARLRALACVHSPACARLCSLACVRLLGGILVRRPARLLACVRLPVLAYSAVRWCDDSPARLSLFAGVYWCDGSPAWRLRAAQDAYVQLVAYACIENKVLYIKYKVIYIVDVSWAAVQHTAIIQSLKSVVMR